MKRLWLLFYILFAASWTMIGQEPDVVRDSLPPAVKTERYSLRIEPGKNMIDRGMVEMVLSPIGERDIVKVIQTLPGISTAIEGGNAYYVRGGNLGGNAVSIDGVRVYGTGHLFGLSSVYSHDMVEVAELSIGGFQGEEDNLTSSQIRVITKDDYYSKLSGNTFVSNNFVGGAIGGGAKGGKVGAFVAARLSPIGQEWKIFERFAHNKDYRHRLQELDASVYDIIGKIGFRQNDCSRYELMTFYSKDAFSYGYSHYGFAEATENAASWNNLILNLTHSWERGKIKGFWGLSYNRFVTWQGQRMNYISTDNILAVQSRLNEGEFRYGEKVSSCLGGIFSWGGKLRITRYGPGSSVSIDGSGVSRPIKKSMDEEWIWRGAGQLFFQEEWKRDKIGVLRMMGRIPILLCPFDGAIRAIPSPEGSLMGRLFFSDHWCLEGTFDALTQFHHVLEGVPMGWSLDPIIPADDHLLPERSTQVYSGLNYSQGYNAFSAGIYWKEMSHLVYFADATALFSSAIANWVENVRTGNGKSVGMEILFERSSKIWKTRVAYTMSKTDRQIEGENGGMRFPAKYDRRHILNFSSDILVHEGTHTDISLSGFFTWQSGHWETVSVGTFPGYGIDGQILIDGNIYSTTNNYQMPPYVRMDLGMRIKTKKSKNPKYLNLGIFNILNRHNAFAVSYDTVEKKWKAVSLFPIMPSFNYRIEF